LIDWEYTHTHTDTHTKEEEKKGIKDGRKWTYSACSTGSVMARKMQLSRMVVMTT
jgi:hypothetical protein